MKYVKMIKVTESDVREELSAEYSDFYVDCVENGSNVVVSEDLISIVDDVTISLVVIHDRTYSCTTDAVVTDTGDVFITEDLYNELFF